MRTAASLTLALMLAMTSAAQAQTHKLRPGLWEHGITFRSQGGQAENVMAQMQQRLATLPPEQRKMVEDMLAKQGVGLGSKGNTVKVCLSQEDVERDELPPREGCTQTLKRSGNTMSVSFQCQGSPPSSGSGRITIQSPTAYSGDFSSQTVVNGKPVTTDMAQSGQWLSADCGELKPIRR